MTWNQNYRAAATYQQRRALPQFDRVGHTDAVEFVNTGLGLAEFADGPFLDAQGDLMAYLASTSEKVTDQFVYDDCDNNGGLNTGIAIIWAVRKVSRGGDVFEYVREMATKAIVDGLSAGQIRGLLNCMRADAMRDAREQMDAQPFEDDNAPEAALAAEQAAPQAGEFAPVVERMQRLAASLSRPKVRLADDVVLSIAGSGARFPGSINVTSSTRFGGVFHGRIALDGTATVRDEAVLTVLRAFALDPEAALATYGHLTGQCGICGRTLTDPTSVERGIGPICLGRMSL